MLPKLLFLIVFLLNFSPDYAEDKNHETIIDPYTKTITAFYPEPNSDERIGGTPIIELNNGTKWWLERSRVDLFDIWKVGDEIQFMTNRLGERYLSNESVLVKLQGTNPYDRLIYDPSRARTRLMQESMDALSKISHIEGDGRTIFLTDGSSWHVGWWSGRWSKTWNIDQRILVEPGQMSFFGGDATHALYNVDKGWERIDATFLKVE